MKRILVIPGESPEPPGTSVDPAGTPLDLAGTPLGPLGTTGDYKNGYISTNVQRQKLSFAASESFCFNASPKDKSVLIYAVYVEKGVLFGRPRSRPEGAPSSQEGVDAHGRKGSPWARPSFIY